MPTAIAISDVGTELFAKIGVATTFTKLLDIVAAPATGSAPETIDVTVLSSPYTQSISGRLNIPAMEFDYNYTEANYVLAQTAVTGEPEEFLLVYGDGTGVKITGEASLWIEGVTKNSAIMGKLYITAQAIAYQTSTEVTALKA